MPADKNPLTQKHNHRRRFASGRGKVTRY